MEIVNLLPVMGGDFSLMTLFAAFMFGLLGSAHCLGMCGGIMSTLSLARTPSGSGIVPLLAYNSGRIFSYSVAGFIVAVLGSLITDNLLVVADMMRVLASIILVMMALYIANWWKGLVYIENGGRYLWKYLQPLASRLMPVRNAYQALLLGLIWGWLPCGLVYSVLIWALSVADPVQGAAIMLFFGLGTLPAMLMTGVLASQIKDLSRSPGVRSIAAIIIIMFALWQLVPIFSSGQQHAGHNTDTATSNPTAGQHHSEQTAPASLDHGPSDDHTSSPSEY